MSGKASSSSHSSAGLNGTGALSHVYIQYPALRCTITGSTDLYYDDGSKMIILPTSNQLFSWKTAPFSHQVDPSCDSISEGPVLSIKYSLDGKFIAVLRSSREVQFWNRESGETFTQKCRPESESILGFFWTDCPLCHFVLVKSSGLDLLSYNAESKSLQLVETRKLNVSWYVYTHESRLLLLASGMQCKTFNGFQLSSAGFIRLPKFEMVMAKSEANSKPVLAAEDVFIITVYGRIYCLQVDRVAMLLHAYRFYRDAVVQQGSFPIYSSKVAVNVVDNVILVHQVDAKVVILYDVFADSRAPISAPLPLLLRGFPKSNSSLLRLHREESNEDSPETGLKNGIGLLYGNDWTFLVPDLICDVASQSLWKIHLDLEAISASSSDVPSVLEFLQRRKLDASKAKQLCLSMVRTAILEHRPVTMIAKAIDVLVASYANSIKTGNNVKPIKPESSPPSARVMDDKLRNHPLTFSSSDSESPKSNLNGNGKKPVCGETSATPLDANASEQQESPLTSAAISPEEIYGFVFALVEEEMVGDPSYLVSIIVEFLRSASSEKVKVNANLYVLTVQLLARTELYAELGLFVVNKILEPSKEVALQLLESGRQNTQTRKLGLDMLRQLSLHHDYVQLLVQDGYYLEALRYARKHKVITVRPSLFLEAALDSKESQHLAAVLRFFSDFTPGFRSTSDHNTYSRILKEMNSTLAF